MTEEQQDGATVSHRHDAVGRRTATLLPDWQQLHYRWDERGQLAEVSLDGQPLSQHQWDEEGRESARLQGQVVSRYEHDPAGRLTTQRAGLRGSRETLLKRQYSRDAGGRIAAIDDLRQGATRYVYDPADRLLGVEGATPERFVHDPAGNLLDGEASAHGNTRGDQLNFHGDRHFRYDAAGNLTEERSGKAGQRQVRYEYDAEHRLTAAHTPEASD